MAARFPETLLGLCLALGCAGTPGRSDFDPAADFASFQTFAVIDPIPQEEAVPRPTQDVVKSQLIDRRVHEALEAGLAAKGLRSTGEESADVLVAFTVGSRRATRTEFYPMGGYHSWPYAWWYDHWDQAYTEIYTEGLLIVDVIDAKTHQLVWRGWTTDPLPPSANIEQTVDHAVSTVLAEYPPQGPGTGSGE